MDPWLIVAALCLVANVLTVLWLRRVTREPLPPLDPVPRSAVVTYAPRPGGDEPDTAELLVETADGQRSARLIDVIDESEWERFAVGSRWWVYVFPSVPGRALLTEAHEDVLRCGYQLHGVRIGAEASYRPPTPGSPLLNGQFTFAGEASDAGGEGRGGAGSGFGTGV